MAGSWATVEDGKRKATGGVKSRIVNNEAAFVADAADGSVPVLKVGSDLSSGLLQRVAIVFGTPAPAGAELMIQVTDSNGLVIVNAAAEKIAASSDVDCNKAFVGELFVYISGNTTNSAEGKVSLYVIS